MPDPRSRDDYERLRQQRASYNFPDTDRVGGGVPAFVGQVTSKGSNIAVGHFLLVLPRLVLGSETEGGQGSFTSVGSKTIPVYLVGPSTPSTGDLLVCRFVDNRWVAEKSSSGSSQGGLGSIPFCFCQNTPATLTMTSADPKCNFGMFQSGTIQWGPTPLAFAPLNLGAYTYLGTQSWPDPVTINNAIGGWYDHSGALRTDPAKFYYYLTCQSNQWFVTRIYVESPYGSPYRDGPLYTWLIGGYGNSCKPFHLDNGIGFPGSDLSCHVTIDG